MARGKARKISSLGFGRLFGDAVGEGFADGLATVMPRLEAELASFVDDIVTQLRSDYATALAAQANEPVEVIPSARDCQDPGCTRRAVARGLCRRHYARQIYQERREREGKPVRRERVGARPRRERVKPSMPAEKKAVAPVAPTVRRKGAVVTAPTPEPVQSTPAVKPAPAVDDVARFFGLK